MESISQAIDQIATSANTMFILIGAILVFAMHAGFAFLEVGTVRQKNQVNALVKIMTDFAVSALAYFFVGFSIAYGIDFYSSATDLAQNNGYELVKFFFLMTFAAAIPAIISGGVAERAKFYPMLIAAALVVVFVYSVFEGIIWNGNMGLQAWLESMFGAPFHDFAGSLVVHGVGGWVALAAVIILGDRQGRRIAFLPSNIPFLALGAWILAIGWFGFNVMSAQTMDGISGLVALNSLMAMVGGIISTMLISNKDPGFIHNGPLAGLVAVCAGSDVMHPLGSLLVGCIAGAIFVLSFMYMQRNLRKVDDVLGVWPLHGLCGVWGALAAGIFGQEFFGGIGSVSFLSQLFGSVIGVVYAFGMGYLIYFAIDKVVGIRLSAEDECNGADLAIHKINAVNIDKI